MTRSTKFALPPGPVEPALARQVLARIVEGGWVTARVAEELLAPGDRRKLVLDGSERMHFWPDRGTKRSTAGTLIIYDVVPIDEMIAIAKLLRSPVSVLANEKPWDRGVRWLARDGHKVMRHRLRGYGEGLIGLHERDLFGPAFSALFGERLATVGRDIGDGFWLVEARGREAEVIDVLGRDAFYDFEHERKPWKRPVFDVPDVNRYVLGFRAQNFSIERARDLLATHGFSTATTPTGFSARWRGDTELRVRTLDVSRAREEIGSAYLEEDDRARLATFDGALEVAVDDTDAETMEVNTVTLSQRLLEEGSGGLLLACDGNDVYGSSRKLANMRYSVLYRAESGFSIRVAREALREDAFDIHDTVEGFTARWHGGPVLYVRVDDIDRVRAFTNDALAPYDAVLDVSFDVLDEALDEVNTVIESQQRLANASGGALYMHWNRTLQTEF